MKKNYAQSGYNTHLPEFSGIVTVNKGKCATFYISKLMGEDGRIENRSAENHEPECS